MLKLIENAVIAEVGEQEWLSIRDELVNEASIYLMYGDINPLIRGIENHIEGFTYSPQALNEIENIPKQLNSEDIINNIKTSNTIQLSMRTYTYKDKYYGIHRDRGLYYYYYNQYLGNKEEPLFVPELENGIQCTEDYSKVDIKFSEKRYHKKGGNHEYKLYVLREGETNPILVDTFITTEKEAIYRENYFMERSINFEFKCMDIILITSRGFEASHYNWVNLSLKFK